MGSFSEVAAAGLLVLGEDDRVALALRHLDRDRLLVEEALGDRVLGALVAGDRPGVLALAVDLLLAGAQLTGAAHMEVVVRIPKPVEDHPVDEIAVAHPVARAGLGQVVGRVGHRLHAACHEDLAVAGLDLLRREHDRLEPRPADLVDRERPNRIGHPGPLARLPRRRLPNRGGQDAAHDHLGHVAAFDLGASKTLPDRNRTELGRRE